MKSNLSYEKKWWFIIMSHNLWLIGDENRKISYKMN